MLVVLAIGCKNEQTEEQTGSLEGRWELVSATVDGSNTDRLRDLYFVFLPDSSVQTNLMGSEANYKYTLEDHQITQFSDPQVIYTMQSLSDSTLVLEMQVQGATFNISLGRGKASRTIEAPTVETEDMPAD